MPSHHNLMTSMHSNDAASSALVHSDFRERHPDEVSCWNIRLLRESAAAYIYVKVWEFWAREEPDTGLRVVLEKAQR